MAVQSGKKAGVSTGALLSLLLVIALTGAATFGSALAESNMDRRVKFGLTMFQAMLAADMDILAKKGEEDKFLVILVYGKDKRAAERGMELLERIGQEKQLEIKGVAAGFAMASLEELQGMDARKIAGLFLAEPLSPEELGVFVLIGVRRGLMAFSPFEGDVEAGAFAGLSVEAKVRPYINTKTMRKSGIRVKPFFLKVAKQYE